MIDEEKMRDSCKYRFPTLKSLFPLSGELTKQIKRPLYKTLLIKIKEKNIKEEECVKLCRTISYFLHPNKMDRLQLFEGEIVGFMNEFTLFSNNKLDYFKDNYYEKKNHKEIFMNLCSEIKYQYQQMVNFFLQLFINKILCFFRTL